MFEDEMSFKSEIKAMIISQASGYINATVFY